MEVHRQRCQACQSIDVRNLLVREPGHPQTVYVKCAQCGALVARYVLEDYYHHGKGLESYLRSHTGTVVGSGREVVDALEDASTSARAGFERALAHLHALGKEV